MSETVRVVRRWEPARHKMAIQVERPQGFVYKAGQNADLRLPQIATDDQFDGSRSLSIASAPCEELLTFAVRDRESIYKKAFKSLREGDRVTVDGPFGTFGDKLNYDEPVVFLAGGIGITPILSLIRQMAHEDKTPPTWLFYSNRTPDQAAFLDELKQLHDETDWFTLVPTVTRVDRSELDGSFEHGRIDAAMLKRHLPEGIDPQFYLCGSTDMVWGVLAELDKIAQRSRVHIEDFTGFE
ncbi:MAG TPA: FAD-dependent oxidoreductase [candidate division Zixibacteria bacterium]|nr:FAD-dependent oxidoreductase [candidate division Zixibacteria bacterium]